MIVVLRYGHRISRDKRVTTHVGLVARAFGADGIVISGEDPSVPIKTIEDVRDRWGGKFFARYEQDWRKFIKEWKKRGKVVHLTMYGIPVGEAVKKIDPEEDLLIVVGSEKVPPEMYELADYNVSVGNQPHSEIAALAVFLDRLLKGKGIKKEFEGAKIRVIPSERGKKVVDR